MSDHIGRRVRARAGLITVGLIAAFVGLAPLAPAHAQAPDHGQSTFILGIKQDIDSLNPFVGVVVSAFESYQLMYDTLTGYAAADFAPEPGLAERWETSPDGLTWTYHIRHGVKWSDGEDLTADDVVYTFQRVLDGEIENGQYGGYLTYVTDVEATDDYTVVVTTSEPSPSMLRLAVPILPEHVWQEIDGDEVATFVNNDSPVGSGPFRLVEARANQFYRFAANKEHWAGAPKIDELVLRIFADDEAMAQALRAGEIDMLQDVSAPIFESLEGEPGITVSDSLYSGFNELAFNLGAQTVDNVPIGDGHPALQDRQVRLAIDYAIDRGTLVDRVLRNHGSPASGVIPPIYDDLHWTPGDGIRGSDLDRANQILDEAGYARGTDGVRAGPDGRRLEFRLFGREESETSQRNVEYIRDWLGELGMVATVQIMSEDALTTAIGQGEFDLFEWGWVVEPDPDFQLSVFTCDQRSVEDGGEIFAGWSDSFYCNPAFDELYNEQKTVLDPADRAAVIEEAQQLLYDDVVYSMLFYYNNFQAYRSDRFTGFVAQPSGNGTLVFQYGTHSYRNITPIGGGAEPASDNRWMLVVGGVAALAVVVAITTAVAVRRRRATADERE